MNQKVFDRLFSISLSIFLIFSYFFTINIASAGEKEVLSKEIVIIGNASESILVESYRDIIITAIGDDQNGAASEATIEVMAMPDVVVLSESISLKKGQTKSFVVSHNKNPHSLKIFGKSGRIMFKIDQKR
jgi:hypothetical protein